MAANKKIRIGVIFGGRSAEHEVSLVSADSVMRNLDPKKYEVVPIGITKTGKWLTGTNALPLLKSDPKTIPPALRASLVADTESRGLVSLGAKLKNSSEKLDILFPVLHGTFGEDGAIQGMLEMAGIPYVGCGVLGSAVGMDKIAQKLIYEAIGVPTPQFEYFTGQEFKVDNVNILRRLKNLSLPVFVKPANLGSSVGISKVKQGNKLKQAIQLALKYDNRVLVEQAIPNALEIEVAVLGNTRPKASVCGQIIASNEFYDYNAKYVDGKSEAIIPAPIAKVLSDKIRIFAVQAYQALDLSGMARVDFLVNSKTKAIYLNEVNTIPGFTSISMYPKLWQASGLTYPKLLDELIQLGLERASSRKKLLTNFKLDNQWYK